MRTCHRRDFTPAETVRGKAPASIRAGAGRKRTARDDTMPDHRQRCDYPSPRPSSVSRRAACNVASAVKTPRRRNPSLNSVGTDHIPAMHKRAAVAAVIPLHPVVGTMSPSASTSHCRLSCDVRRSGECDRQLIIICREERSPFQFPTADYAASISSRLSALNAMEIQPTASGDLATRSPVALFPPQRRGNV